MATIVEQLTQLERDRQDLVDNLETKGITGLTGDETFTELVPEVLNISGGGGGLPATNSYYQLKSNLNSILGEYSDYLKSLFSSYPVYTNNSVTLYTPDATCTNYFIQKRSSGKYRVIWFINSGNSEFTAIKNDTTFGYCSLYNQQYFPGFDENTLEYTSTNITPPPYPNPTPITKMAYYSNELNTIEDVITNMQLQNGSLTYTQWTSGSDFGGVLDSTYLIPYSNTLVYDLRNSTNEFVMSQRISKNETIVTIS